ncbi:glycosyltransferase family 39 protein [Candidatus Saccharibacteria bacterium]|nr:glycosyltransferase family 39 protein [Candidatus Saccharibacteria bacterium]
MEKTKGKRINLKSARLWATVILLLGVVFLGYGWNLGSYVDGFSKSEAASISASKTIGLENIVNAPYLYLQKTSMQVIDGGIGVRLPSVLIGLFSIGLFYLLMRQLTNPRIAVLSSLMFAGADWMLHVSRLGDPTVTTILWPIAALLIAYNVYKFNLEWYWYVVAGLVLGIATYTPRMIYFVVFAIVVAIMVFHRYDTKLHKAGAVAGMATFGLAILPIIVGAVLNPSQISDILALPSKIPTPISLIDNLAIAVRSIAWKADSVAYLNLANLALVDIVTLIFALLGLLVIFTDVRAPRGWLLLSMLISSLLIVAVLPVKDTNAYFLLPTISIFSGIGLFTLWTRWRDNFPTNKIARSFALIILGVVVVSSMSYNFERYYLAWSKVPETQAAFSKSIDGNVIIER